MKKLISFLIGVLVIALVITCIVAFTTCDGCDVPKTNVETEDKGDNNQQEDISFYIRYNGEDVKDKATLTFKEYDLNAIDIWGSDDYSYTVSINNAAGFEYTVNGQETTSALLKAPATKYFCFNKTPTGYEFGINHSNSLEYVLSKLHSIDGKDAEIKINYESLFEKDSGKAKYIFKLGIMDDISKQGITIYFNLETASLELPGKIII